MAFGTSMIVPDWVPKPQDLSRSYITGIGRSLPASDTAWRDNYKLQRMMRRDPDILPAIMLRELASTSLEWSIVAPGGEDAEPMEQERSKAIETAIRDMDSLPHMIDSLVQADWYGVAASSIRYERIGPRSNKEVWIAPVDHVSIDPDAIAWNEDGELIIRTGWWRNEWPDGASKVVTPDGQGVLIGESLRSNFVVHRWALDHVEHTDGYTAERIFRGEGLRSMLYEAWKLKQYNQQNQRHYSERMARGSIIVKYLNNSPESQRSAQELLDAMYGSFGVIYATTDPNSTNSPIEFIEANGTGFQIFRDLWEADTSSLRKTILLQDLTQDSNHRGLGGGQLGEVHERTFAKVVKKDAKLLGSSLTKELIRVMYRANWGPAKKYPSIRYAFEDADNTLDDLNKLFTMGVSFAEEYARKVAGVPDPTEGQKTVASLSMGNLLGDLTE